MPKEQSPGKPTTRRYSPEEKAAAVRMVRTLRAELGTDHGTVYRVARQLGYGVESVRTWVREADIDDGYAPGVSTAESQRIKELEPGGERVAETASATSKSAVSRKFVAMTETALAELLSGDLSGLDLVALMI